MSSGEFGKSVPAPATPPADPDRPTITLSGWSDLYFSYNFNAPSNGLNALRLYDAKHDHVGFNSLAFDVAWSVGPVSGHAVLQLGTLISEFYPYAGTVTRVQQELPFRLMQEVTLGWRPTLGGRQPLAIEGGIFVAPFGVEYIQIYKNWNWSPSNLFYICPFQIAGLRASWTFNDRWTVRGGVYSGWDQIVDDDNAFRTVLLQGEYSVGERFFLSAQYMIGVERSRGAPEGPWTRHAFDLYADYQPLQRLQLRAHVFTGLEPNRLGTAGWFGAALYARVKAFDWLYLAARGDIVREWVPDGAASMFGLDASLLGSATVTAELLPHRHLSFRVEYRHDQANADQYFRDNVPQARMTGTDLPNASGQYTVTVGATAWF